MSFTFDFDPSTVAEVDAGFAPIIRGRSVSIVGRSSLGYLKREMSSNSFNVTKAIDSDHFFQNFESFQQGDDHSERKRRRTDEHDEPPAVPVKQTAEDHNNSSCNCSNSPPPLLPFWVASAYTSSWMQNGHTRCETTQQPAKELVETRKTSDERSSFEAIRILPPEIDDGESSDEEDEDEEEAEDKFPHRLPPLSTWTWRRPIEDDRVYCSPLNELGQGI